MSCTKCQILLQFLISLHIYQGIKGEDYEKGNTASLACNAHISPPESITVVRWSHYHDDQNKRTQVVYWRESTSEPPEVNDPWKDRVDLDTDDADIVISNLQLSDNGPYTCYYGTIVDVPPAYRGSTHQVNIIGKNH